LVSTTAALGDSALADPDAVPPLPSWSNGDIDDMSPSVQAAVARTTAHADAHISARRQDNLKV
jgi:hypothetical protein